MTYEDCLDDYGDLLLKSLQDCTNIPFGVYKEKENASFEAAWGDLPKRASKCSWTAEETDVLTEYLGQHENDWRGAAQQVSALGTSRTPQQCEQRWRRVVNPDLVKGRWTKEEDRLLRDLCQRDTIILNISKKMRHRSYVQVRNRMALLKLGRFGSSRTEERQ